MLVFIASTVLFALLVPARPEPINLLLTRTEPLFHAADLALRPQSGALWVLLVIVWLTMVLHLVTPTDPERAAAPHENGVRDLFSAALICGAIWPWMTQLSVPLSGLLAVIMAVLALASFLYSPRTTRSISLGFFTGWAILTGLMLAGVTITGLTGLPPAPVEALMLALVVVVAVLVQIKHGSGITFPLSVIIGLIGISGAALGQSPILTTLAIGGIAALALVLVLEAT